MYSKAIIVAALTASASAQMPALLPRQTETDDVDFSSPTESTSPECESRIESWTGAFPTPPPSLADALNDNPDGGMAAEGVWGLCYFAAGLGKNEASDYSSFNLDMYSYLSGQSSNLVAIATSCSADMGAPPSVITSQLDELLTVYSSFSAGACKDIPITLSTLTSSPHKSSASSGFLTSALPTLTSSGTGSSSTGSATDSATTSAANSANASGAPSSTAPSTVSPNAGPRETGMFAAAAMAMGALGAAMVL